MTTTRIPRTTGCAALLIAAIGGCASSPPVAPPPVPVSVEMGLVREGDEERWTCLERVDREAPGRAELEQAVARCYVPAGPLLRTRAAPRLLELALRLESVEVLAATCCDGIDGRAARAEEDTAVQWAARTCAAMRQSVPRLCMAKTEEQAAAGSEEDR